jgi:hypothetical protein
MTEPRRDTLVVRHEIERTRDDLASNVARLRGVLRQRLSVRRQLHAHPRVAATAAVILALPLFALAFVARAIFARRARTQRRVRRVRRVRQLLLRA